MTVWQVALASLVGGLLAVERKGFAQFMMARPIVVAPIVAWILGDARAGLALGVPLELFFLGTSSYGASTPNHETLSALFGAALATCADHRVHPVPGDILVIAFFFALPLAPLGRWLEATFERQNGALVDQAERLLLAGHPGKASRRLFLGLMPTLAMGSVVTLAGATCGPLVGLLVHHLPTFAFRGLDLAWALAIGVSSGLAIRAIKVPRGLALSGVAAAMVFVTYDVMTSLWGTTFR